MFRNNTNRIYNSDTENKIRSYKWNTKSITNMSYMFNKSSGFKSRTTTDLIDFKSWDVNNVIYMEYMFEKFVFINIILVKENNENTRNLAWMLVK